jgi:hypothetical protein
MNAESIVAISAGVVAVTQLIKWAGMKDSLGPLVVIILSGVGVGLWLFSQEAWPPLRTDTWNIASGWVTVALSAAGTFGFTRAAASAVTRGTPPPADGAGSSGTTPTVNEVADELERRLRAERVRTV